jgi:hypothetical protein
MINIRAPIAKELNEAWLPMTAKQKKWAKKNLIRGTNRHLCICETLRLIYDEIIDMEDEKKKELITKRLIDAFMMGKKMSDRLHYYKEKYDDKTGKGGQGLIYIMDTKKRRAMRSSRKI